MTIASRSTASASSFRRLLLVLRNMKCTSMVVTGDPCNAAAALPIMTTSSRCRAMRSATSVSMGAAFMTETQQQGIGGRSHHP